MYEIKKVYNRKWHTAEPEEGYQIFKDGKPLRHLVAHMADTRRWYEKLYKKHLPCIAHFDTIDQAQSYIENRTTELPEPVVMNQVDKELASDVKTTLKPNQ